MEHRKLSLKLCWIAEKYGLGSDASALDRRSRQPPFEERFIEAITHELAHLVILKKLMKLGDGAGKAISSAIERMPTKFHRDMHEVEACAAEILTLKALNFRTSTNVCVRRSIPRFAAEGMAQFGWQKTAQEITKATKRKKNREHARRMIAIIKEAEEVYVKARQRTMEYSSIYYSRVMGF